MTEPIYVKLFADDLTATEELTYEEKGRLYEAMIRYASTGEHPKLSGNERFIFPVMKARIDRDRKWTEEHKEEISRKRSEAGKKGAVARWSEGKESLKGEQQK